MTECTNLGNTQDLIDALKAFGGIDESQAKSLTGAFASAGGKTPAQVLAESGIFTENQVPHLVKTLGYMEAGKLSKEQLAVFMMSLLMDSRSLDTALAQVEEYVNPRTAPDLPTVFTALLTARQITPGVVEEFRQDSNPQKDWKAFCVSKGVLEPHQIEEVAEATGFVEDGELTVHQFAVCFFDMFTTNMSLRKSIQMRGWWPSSRPIA